ncbi:hypothetical protein ACJX0J_038375, partial [Zea mays]
VIHWEIKTVQVLRTLMQIIPNITRTNEILDHVIPRFLTQDDWDAVGCLFCLH